VALSRAERRVHFGLLATLGLALLVVLGGLSGAGPQPLGRAALGAALAIGAGLSISVNTVLCRQLHDAGVDPIAMVSVRFVGAIVLALALAIPAGHDFAPLYSASALPTVLGAAALLVVLPIYVSQVGISLASPLTVRAVLAVAPVLIFVLQLADGRMSASPYSLTAAVAYGIFAVSAAVTRHRAIHTAVLASATHP
jgi:drug/metabolite transporter (DMT)-like permease